MATGVEEEKSDARLEAGAAFDDSASSACDCCCGWSSSPAPKPNLNATTPDAGAEKSEEAEAAAGFDCCFGSSSSSLAENDTAVLPLLPNRSLNLGALISYVAPARSGLTLALTTD